MDNDTTAVGVVLEDGQVGWFRPQPVGTFVYVHTKKSEHSELLGRHRWVPRDEAEYAANHYGSELAGDIGFCKICDKDMFDPIHISPLDPDPQGTR